MAESHPLPISPRFQNLTGQAFGRLRVVSFAGKRKGTPVWHCDCECGGKTVSRSGDLKSGDSTSCGCAKIQAFKARVTKHGATVAGKKRSEYTIWCLMKRRCHAVASQDYAYYGGRGIGVCARWLESFENFLADMGDRPSPQHSIDRIDNAAGYCKENCRWATKTEQANNARKNRRIEHDGQNHTVAEWARILGISASLINSRLAKGWTDHDALTKAKHEGVTRHARLITRGDQTHTLAEWSRITGLSYSLIRSRLDARNWTVEDALTVGKGNSK